MDKDAYIKRMEDAVMKANVAMGKLRQENTQLLNQVATLEAKVASLEKISKKGFGKLPFSVGIASPPASKIVRSTRNDPDYASPLKKLRTDVNMANAVLPVDPPSEVPSAWISATPYSPTVHNEIEDEIGAALDEMSSSEFGSDSESDSGESSAHNKRSNTKVGSVPTSVETHTDVHTNPPNVQSSSEMHVISTQSMQSKSGARSLRGWTKIALAKNKTGVQPTLILSQLNEDTVHSVSNALSGCAAGAVSNAIYHLIEVFARANRHLWDSICGETLEDDNEISAAGPGPVASELSALIASVVSLLRSFVTSVSGDRGLSCYRETMFLLQHHALAVRRVCGVTKAPVDVLRFYLLRGRHQQQAASFDDIDINSPAESSTKQHEDALGGHFDGKDEDNGDSLGEGTQAMSSPVSAPLDTEFCLQDIGISSLLSDIDNFGKGGENEEEVMVDITVDDDDDAEVDVKDNSYDEGMDSLIRCGETSGKEEGADSGGGGLQGNDGKDGSERVVGVTAQNTKSVRQLLSFLITAIAVEASLTLEPEGNLLPIFLQRYACMAPYIDLLGASCGILYGMHSCGPQLIDCITSKSDWSMLMVPMHMACCVVSNIKYDFVKFGYSLFDSLRKRLQSTCDTNNRDLIEICGTILEYLAITDSADLSVSGFPSLLVKKDFGEIYELYRQCMDLVASPATTETSRSPVDVINGILSQWAETKVESGKPSSHNPSSSCKQDLLYIAAGMIAVSNSNRGFWGVMGAPGSDASENALAAVFTNIGLFNIDTFAKDIVSIDSAIQRIAMSADGFSCDEYKPIAIRSLIGCNERMYSDKALPNGSNVEYFAISELSRHWKGTLRKMEHLDSLTINQSTQAIICCGDMLHGMLFEFTYANRRGFDNNSARNVKHSFELHINGCKQRLAELQLPTSSSDDTLTLPPHGMPATEWGVAATASGWCDRIHYTLCSDVEQRSFSNAVLYLNHCMVLLPRIANALDESAIKPLITHISHLCVQVSLSMFKVLVSLYCCSLRALLKEIAVTAVGDMSNSVRQALALLCSTAIRHNSYSETVDIYAAARCLQPQCQPWLNWHSMENFTRKIISGAFLKCPVMIINLDSRVDRWQNCLRECATHGLLAARLSAVDAKKTRYNFGSEIGTSTEEISEDVVTTTWDSTLNARFDKATTISKALLMTPSERACAMSHVLAWKVAFYSSLWSGDGVCKPLLRESEARLAKTPPIYLTSPRSFVSSTSDIPSDTAEIQMYMSLRSHSQWINGYFLVMEDDIEIKLTQPGGGFGDGKSFLVKLRELTQALPKDTDICYLGYILPKGAEVKRGKKFIKPTYLWQLHAYLLSASGAKKLLSHLPVNAPVDNFVASLIHENMLTAYAVPHKGRLVKQAAGTFKARRSDSDIVHSGRIHS